MDFSQTSRKRWDKGGKPGSFDFLGFTHYWAKSLKETGDLTKTERKPIQEGVTELKECAD